MSIYTKIKEHVTVKDTARFYGLHPNRNGMLRCPFHPDNTPSMKVDHRFHCFSCGADGDVIDFVSKLYGVPVKDAAEKIARDFGIALAENNSIRKERNNSQSKEEKKYKDLLENCRQRCWYLLCDYLHILHRWKEDYRPKPDDQDRHPRFREACHKEAYINELLDQLWEADDKELEEFILLHGKEVAGIERRVKQIQSEDRSGNGYTNNGACGFSKRETTGRVVENASSGDDSGGDQGRTGVYAERQPEE